MESESTIEGPYLKASFAATNLILRGATLSLPLQVYLYSWVASRSPAKGAPTLPFLLVNGKDSDRYTGTVEESR